MKIKSKNILITGVSTGIGYDLVKVFLANEYIVYGSVRKQQDADRLLKEFGNNFHPMLFDVTDHKSIENVADQLKEELKDEGLGGLINNAGVAIGGPFIDLTIEDFRYPVEVNVFGLIKVTQEFLPLLGAQSDHPSFPGKIFQISSVSGKNGMPFISPYTGSKHALEGITESLRKELLLFGIDVVLIEPGPIKTPIWNKGASDLIEKKFEDSVYSSILKRYHTKFIIPTVKKAWTSDKAAGIIFNIFEKRRPKVRYVITAHKLKSWTLPRMLPTRTLDKIIGKALGLIK